MEAAQKAATESQQAPAAGVTRTSLSEEEPSSATEVAETPVATPDYAAGLLPSNPPLTPSVPTSTTPFSSVNPIPALKEANVTRVVMMQTPVRPVAPLSSVVPTTTTPAQVVRLVTAQPTTGTSLATPTVYRLVQPAASTGQPAAAATAAQPAAAPQKKSVALMLTVTTCFFSSSLFI